MLSGQSWPRPLGVTQWPVLWHQSVYKYGPRSALSQACACPCLPPGGWLCYLVLEVSTVGRELTF